MTDLRRFFVSPHCRDLRVIAQSAVVLAIVCILYAIPGIGPGQSVDPSLLAVVLGGLFAAVAWAFQSANLRFGAADIFASEITTLCRVSSVIGLIPRLVKAYTPDGQRINPSQSTQDYVVIFHNNSKDLEILDGEVVTFVTEFYVHFKAMLDTMSRIPHWDQDTELSAEKTNRYEEALLGVIYMAFLTFESGRESLMRLIDESPVRHEALLIALLNEIPAYIFLHQVFETRHQDLRKQRISRRLPHYQSLLRDIKSFAAAEGAAPKVIDLANAVIARWNDGGPELTNLAEGPATPNAPT